MGYYTIWLALVKGKIVPFWELESHAPSTRMMRRRFGVRRLDAALTVFTQAINQPQPQPQSCQKSSPKLGELGVAADQVSITSFEQWYAELGPRPSPEHSVDHFPNNDGNYEPGNVRWASTFRMNTTDCRPARSGEHETEPMA